MLKNSHSDIFPIFFGVWMVLCLFSAAFFSFSKNAKLKRKVWPPFTIGTAILFVGFVWAMDSPSQTFLFMIPVVALIVFLNLRSAKFCDACGKTNMSRNPFFRSRFCSKCGAKLEP
ncbi:hypothetical protein [Duganella sp. Dugasp56]|uniref:hypothetical protein n=1 Tax=Duganella sp. Dugasp56 TaxID=3243046 RepID=UPI0039AF6931